VPLLKLEEPLVRRHRGLRAVSSFHHSSDQGNFNSVAHIMTLSKPWPPLQ
jgi:hypothetical protein